jgi:hypothetical protein
LGVKIGLEAWQCPTLLILDFRDMGVRNLIRSAVPRRMAMEITGRLTGSALERHKVVDQTDLREAIVEIEYYFERSGWKAGSYKPVSLLLSIRAEVAQW